MASKNTSNIIPLCHPLMLSDIHIEFKLNQSSIDITSVATCNGPTGVEMEALIAVQIASATIYDMCKAIDKTMIIQNIRLIKKSKEPILDI
jgi:cyclic pyranopterin phosphate synthase